MGARAFSPAKKSIVAPTQSETFTDSCGAYWVIQISCLGAPRPNTSKSALLAFTIAQIAFESTSFLSKPKSGLSVPTTFTIGHLL